MQPYLREREKKDRSSRVIGIALVVALHGAGFIICANTGLKYLYPPPPELSFVIDFDEVTEEQIPVKSEIGREPQAEETDPENPVELVRQAESPYVADEPNVTTSSEPDNFGDVEVPAPPVEEPKLDARASFPGMSPNPNDATTPHSAAESSAEFKPGQPDGNVTNGKTEGTANARLQGRSVIGTISKPAYAVQKEGTVVVQIKVNQYGNVVEALAGVEGTTVTDKDLWNAARIAAMKTNFNMSADAPPLQIGTITYIFKLK